MTRHLAGLSAALAIGLFMLCLAWEWRLAPLRPGGSWLVLKALPLLLPIPGLLRGRRYTYQWTTLLVLAYFSEGVVRAASESGLAQLLAAGETVLAVALFGCAIGFVRAERRLREAARPAD
jgi:uncharacterized membrane protein